MELKCTSVPCDQVKKCIILRNSLLIITSIAFPIDNNPTPCALRIPRNLSLYETEQKLNKKQQQQQQQQQQQ